MQLGLLDLARKGEVFDDESFFSADGFEAVAMIDGEYIVSSPEVFSRSTTTGVSFTDRRSWKPFGRENTVSSGCSGFRDKQRGSKIGDRLSL